MSALKQLLHSVNYQKYHIIFGEKGFANHIVHGLVALDRIGASKEQMQQYRDRYVRERLEPAKNDPISIDKSNWLSWRGKKHGYVEMADFFHEEIKSRGRKQVLSHYLPHLIEGMYASAFHPIIHIGYAIEADHDESIAGGLAFFLYAYRSLGKAHVKDDAIEQGPPLDLIQKGEKGAYKAETQLSDCLKEVAADQRFENAYQDQDIERRKHDEHTGDFIAEMELLGERCQDVLQEYANRLPFIHERAWKTTDEVVASTLPVLRQIIQAYGSTVPPDDFFMLHGVTSFWSLQQVLPYLPSVEWQHYALFVYAQALIAVYLAQGAPKLVKIEHTEAVKKLSWEQVLERTRGIDYDTHLVKLVFTCHRLAETVGDEDKSLLHTAASKAEIVKWPQGEKEDD